ncbi:adenine nucleotide alpha hydrolases-like protein [Eremomyces bilateralis CBS 781.70]|uniref:Diphthine--ammonia ligase n=1 Tax=Eremomyces bilateralis CBS 781.70 TaxID=1392243 RepID=A0A6G1GAN2_9PEZI|nr:adenine nucleotide alpha hydrolases-like protein [Eremomyces bilateralis CBS 781.70]KAF1815084.1 adenine nucleotide alpha hydrolases-like protein [Eremomyces bilateralis CBS 781.70]
MLPSSATHDVIALISGGKDSIFSILQCEANGHRVVALANLYPAPRAHDPADADADANDDPDSFMYQTAGHTVVPHYAQLLGLPLYRAPIIGAAVETTLEYHPHERPRPGSLISGNGEGNGTHGIENLSIADASSSPPTPAAVAPTPTLIDPPPSDETESLLPLLRRVLSAHPSATAVSTGAVLSTYQRTRIESICARLRLVSLSPLWQWPSLPPAYAAASLLDTMRAAGMVARIVKVASAGIGEGELWADVLGEGRAQVVKGLRRILGDGGEEVGGAVVGEGGEYETVVVSGPPGRWKGRIEAGEVEKVRGEGDVWWVNLKGVKVVDVEEGDVVEGDRSTAIKPTLLDAEFEEVLSTVATEVEGVVPSLTVTPEIPRTDSHLRPSWFTHNVGLTVYLSNMHASPDERASPSEQLEKILVLLRQYLRDTYASTPSSIVSSTLLLRSMSDFTVLNPIYAAFFPLPLPPARVAVSCGSAMPPGCDVLLSVVVELGRQAERTGLHVQSWSYWAPANIGPYSQAIAIPLLPVKALIEENSEFDMRSAPKIIYMAGQIPLVPSSMQLLDHPLTSLNISGEEVVLPETGSSQPYLFLSRTVLALQHLFRVGRSMSVHCWLSGIAYIAIPPSHSHSENVELHLKSSSHTAAASARTAANEVSDTEDEESHEIDVWDLQNRPAWVAQQKEQAPQPNPSKHLQQTNTVDHRPRLPDMRHVHMTGATTTGYDSTPPMYVVRVAELPRGADIEWSAVGMANGDAVVQWLDIPGIRRKFKRGDFELC